MVLQGPSSRIRSLSAIGHNPKETSNHGLATVNPKLVIHGGSNLTEVSVAAVCQSRAGKIDRGGSTIVNLLPGGGSTGKSVEGFVSGTPAKHDPRTARSAGCPAAPPDRGPGSQPQA